MIFIILKNFSSHRNLSSLLDLLSNLFRHNLDHFLQGNIFDICPHANQYDSLSEGLIICNDLAKLREMPSIPFPQSHSIIVQLFVEVFEQAYGLYNHGVDFFGGE